MSLVVNMNLLVKNQCRLLRFGVTILRLCSKSLKNQHYKGFLKLALYMISLHGPCQTLFGYQRYYCACSIIANDQLFYFLSQLSISFVLADSASFSAESQQNHRVQYTSLRKKYASIEALGQWSLKCSNQNVFMSLVN